MKKSGVSGIFEYQSRSNSQMRYDQMFGGSHIPEFDFAQDPSNENSHVLPTANKPFAHKEEPETQRMGIPSLM